MIAVYKQRGDRKSTINKGLLKRPLLLRHSCLKSIMALEQYLSQPLLISACVLILTLLALEWWRQNSKLPPGPWGLPILGYWFFISETHTQFFEMSKKYGNVFSFRTVGGRLITILNGHKTIKEVLVNRAEEFIGRPHGNNIVAWVSDGIGITQEEGQPWIEQRKFFLQTARNFGLGKQDFEQQIQDEIKILLQELRKLDGKPNDFFFNLAYTFNSIISKVVFNRKFDKDVTFKKNLGSMNEMVKVFIGNLHMLIGMPFDFFLRILGNKEMPKGKKDILKFVDNTVEEISQNYDSSQPKCYVDAYLQQQDELRKKGKLSESSFTGNRLKANAFNLIFEGTESVSSTIGCFLVELSKHPDVQKKIQKELDSVVGRERLPSWTDKQNLPYLDATIQELSRKAPLFNVLTMYCNFKETTIEGYRIPKRSIIIPNVYSINHDPKLFPNPEKFDPERFLDREGKRIKVEGGPYLYGLGKRACIGEMLAQVEVFLLIGSLLQSFNLPYAKDMDSLRAVPRE